MMPKSALPVQKVFYVPLSWLKGTTLNSVFSTMKRPAFPLEERFMVPTLLVS